MPDHTSNMINLFVLILQSCCLCCYLLIFSCSIIIHVPCLYAYYIYMIHMFYVLLIHIVMDIFEIVITMIKHILYVIIIMLIYRIKIIRKMPICLTCLTEGTHRNSPLVTTWCPQDLNNTSSELSGKARPNRNQPRAEAIRAVVGDPGGRKAA
jgi:hypothetical protein